MQGTALELNWAHMSGMENANMQTLLELILEANQAKTKPLVHIQIY